MLFNSISFLAFFPIVVGIFFFIPARGRRLWLLIASYYFYMCWEARYALLIALSTIVTWAAGLLTEKCALLPGERALRCKRLCVAGSLAINLSILALFKYANFIMENLSAVLGAVGIHAATYRFSFLLPVGISFYTFQALGYTIDVYRGRVRAERNLLTYALFVSFFPQLVAGPIERSENLLKQMRHIAEINVWEDERIKRGLLLMLWGFFEKLVIADRASILVDQVYHHYTEYGFLEIALASFLFTFQIYCDFGGYSDIARGAAQVMGFRLMYNFRQPYLAAGMRDFWRRWHISLTTWFRDYLYIPLGGNRRGKRRQYINIMIVFLTSGLWHGAQWHYVVWGGLHGVYQIAESLLDQALGAKKTLRRKFHRGWRVFCTVISFALVDFSWIFFAADGMGHALSLLRQAGTAFRRQSVLQLGLSGFDYFILIAAILLLMLVDLLHERRISIFRAVAGQGIAVRFLLYLGLFWTVLMVGIYGVEYDTSQFIYFRF